MTNLDQLKQRRPARGKVVDAHKDRMIAETRAWRLQELREQFDLTQVELAAELDVSQNRVYRIQNHSDGTGRCCVSFCRGISNE